MGKLHGVLAGLMGWCVVGRAHAADVPVPGTDRAVEVHGFVSPGFIVSTGSNYLAKSKRGSAELSEVGVNFTVPLTDRLRTGMQLFARDLGSVGNYTPRFDWYYIDYRFEDWLGIRAGRVKIPFGLYNDSSDIDAARVPILLPQSLYDISNRDFFLAQTGAEVYGRARMQRLGAFEYRLYAGTIFIPVGSQTTIPAAVNNLDVPYVVGERLFWETPIEGLRVGGSLQALRLDADIVLPTGVVSFGLPVVLWVASAEYALHDVRIATEYSRWVSRIESNLPTLNARVISERGYVMGSYRVAPWFEPGAYYSVTVPNVALRDGRENVQHDVAATLRFDINNHWLFKLEGHFMSGTAGLRADLNDGKLPGSLDKNWGVFLMKTTAHF